MLRRHNADELVPLILGVIRSVNSHLNKKHRQDMIEFSPLQLRVLGYIRERKKPLMKDVADFMAITPPSATALINGMVKNKLLVRRFDSKDRRAVYLQITPKGERLFKKGFKEMIRHMRGLYRCLSRDEKTYMIRIYRKMYAYFNNLNIK